MNLWDDQPCYTVKAAAKRFQRSTRTIERWIHDGMRCRVVAGVIYIDHEVLMEQFKVKLATNPNRKTREK